MTENKYQLTPDERSLAAAEGLADWGKQSDEAKRAYIKPIHTFQFEAVANAATAKVKGLLDAEIRALQRERIGEVWYWQGDAEDHLESLTCPILIEAQALRDMLAKVKGLMEAEHKAEIDRLLEETATVLRKAVTNMGIAADRVNEISNELHDFDLSKPLNNSFHDIQETKMILLNWSKTLKSRYGGK